MGTDGVPSCTHGVETLAEAEPPSGAGIATGADPMETGAGAATAGAGFVATTRRRHFRIIVTVGTLQAHPDGGIGVVPVGACCCATGGVCDLGTDAATGGGESGSSSGTGSCDIGVGLEDGNSIEDELVTTEDDELDDS